MLTITKTAGNIWTHNTTGISKGYAKWNIDTEEFMLFAENGQAPIKTYEVSEISLVDESVDPVVTYPTYATVLELITQLKSLSYVGFDSGGSAGDAADLISTDPGNRIILGSDSLLKVAPQIQDTTSIPITLSYVDNTSNFSTLLHASYTATSRHFSFENYNNDAWVSGNGLNTNQRIICMFGGNLKSLKSIYYLNGFSNVNSLTPLNTNRGIKNCIIYAITADITPTTAYGVTTGDFQSIYTGVLNQQTDVTYLHSIVLGAGQPCYGFVIDAADNYGGSLMSIRRLIATQ